MDIVYAMIAAVAILASFVGCVVPLVPGPVLAYAALLALIPSRFALSTREYAVFGAACIAVLALDYVVPAIGAKRFNCSRWGVFGCVIGTFAGFLFAPWGIVLGPFAGALAGELVAGKKISAALKGGIGAFIGFVFGVALKLAYCAACAGWLIAGMA